MWEAVVSISMVLCGGVIAYVVIAKFLKEAGLW